MPQEINEQEVHEALEEIGQELHQVFTDKDENEINYCFLIILFLLHVSRHQNMDKEKSYQMFCYIFDAIIHNEKLNKIFKFDEDKE